jgi:tRNA(Ile)-lysidine synthase TilS/MesJ
MKICSRCILPETFPGITFDEEGVCSFCRAEPGREQHEAQKRRYLEKFQGLLQSVKGRYCYDALMLFSGGKDSSYTLHLLKNRFNMNILALTFDNGFIPDQSQRNIRSVTDGLGIDLIVYRFQNRLMNRIFRACADRDVFPASTLTRASAICTACISFVKFLALRTSIEKSIPFNVFGWSPGQIPVHASIMRNLPGMIRPMQHSLFQPLHELAGDAIRPFFLEESHFARESDFPTNVSPLVFLDYDESEILATIKALGWVPPTGIDANSTNCMLNSFANQVHIDRHGFHPYVFEQAKLVREGYVDRDEALAKILRPGECETIEKVKSMLGYRKERKSGPDRKGKDS